MSKVIKETRQNDKQGEYGAVDFNAVFHRGLFLAMLAKKRAAARLNNTDNRRIARETFLLISSIDLDAVDKISFIAAGIAISIH